MKDNDLCTVIGNLIDNAIEAELRENEYREIEISSFWNGEEFLAYLKKTTLKLCVEVSS